MKKFTALFLVVALMLTAFSGCGNNKNNSSAQSSAPVSSVEESSEAAESSAEESSEAEDSSEVVESSVEESSEAVESSAEESSENAQSSAEESQADATVIRLGGLKGPTSMALVSLLDNSENGKTVNQYDFTMAATADELTPKLLKGELDILAGPVNMGSVLYNKSEGKIQIAGVTALGVLYIVEKGSEEVKDMASLKGKTILATGKGTTPEYVLNYLLTQNGLDPEKDVTIEYKSEAAEVVAAMKTMDSAVAMLPQPYVTVAGTQIEDLKIVLNLTEEWHALDNGSELVTAGIIIRKAFAEENPEAMAQFMKELAESVEFVNANVEEAAALIEKYDIVKAQIAQKALPYCNIVMMQGEEMTKAVDGYLQVLFEQAPNSVGGKLPEADIYYLAE